MDQLPENIIEICKVFDENCIEMKISIKNPIPVFQIELGLYSDIKRDVVINELINFVNVDVEIYWETNDENVVPTRLEWIQFIKQFIMSYKKCSWNTVTLKHTLGDLRSMEPAIKSDHRVIGCIMEKKTKVINLQFLLMGDNNGTDWSADDSYVMDVKI
jgi:hypothetical protein